jgi:DNA polymerase-3 subunit delta'
MATERDRRSSLAGHQIIKRMLDTAVEERRVRHAYLFSGPARVGKSTFARWLAQRLDCLNQPGPCGCCRSCLRIERATHPDVRSLQVPGDRGSPIGLPLDTPDRPSRSAERVISIEQIRSLQHDASLAPSEARWKVYVISGVENLSLPAANCVLKTLEEPPASVVLILTTVDAFDLLPTIVSRCQAIRFSPVPRPEIAAWLEHHHDCPPEKADLLARLSGGRPGWAIEAAANATLVADRDRLVEDLLPTLKSGFRQRLDLAERIAAGYSRDPSAVQQTLSAWQVWWWDVQLLQCKCPELVTNVDRQPVLEAIATVVTPERVQAYLQALGEASRRLLANVNPRLTLEALLLQSPAAG